MGVWYIHLCACVQSPPKGEGAGPGAGRRCVCGVCVCARERHHEPLLPGYVVIFYIYNIIYISILYIYISSIYIGAGVCGVCAGAPAPARSCCSLSLSQYIYIYIYIMCAGGSRTGASRAPRARSWAATTTSARCADRTLYVYVKCILLYISYFAKHWVGGNDSRREARQQERLSCAFSRAMKIAEAGVSQKQWGKHVSESALAKTREGLALAGGCACARGRNSSSSSKRIHIYIYI